MEPPADGRVHGGGLTFAAAPSPWEPPSSDTVSAVMPFAEDVSGQTLDVTRTWFSFLALGTLNAREGFTDPGSSADIVIGCLASSGYMRGFSGRKDLFSRPITIDGRSGWTIRSEVRVAGRDDGVEGSVFDVVVINLGTAGQLSVFVAEATIGDQAQYANRDRVMATLRVG